MLKGKGLTDFNNLFSLNDFKTSDDIILKYFTNGWMQFHWSKYDPNLSLKQFRLNQVNQFKDYLLQRLRKEN